LTDPHPAPLLLRIPLHGGVSPWAARARAWPHRVQVGHHTGPCCQHHLCHCSSTLTAASATPVPLLPPPSCQHHCQHAQCCHGRTTMLTTIVAMPAPLQSYQHPHCHPQLHQHWGAARHSCASTLAAIALVWSWLAQGECLLIFFFFVHIIPTSSQVL
jgi:hypothetical protein